MLENMASKDIKVMLHFLPVSRIKTLVFDDHTTQVRAFTVTPCTVISFSCTKRDWKQYPARNFQGSQDANFFSKSVLTVCWAACL